MTPDVVNTLFDTSRDDLATNHIAQFQDEIDRWIVGWDTSADPKLSTLLETLTATNGDLYPNIYICLLIVITMPVTTATAERSFSEISITRRVKTYVRSTMPTDSLSSLAVLYCYKHWEIDINKVSDSFAVK
jgi:hypothetical protein